METIPFSFIRIPKAASGSIDLHLRQVDNYRYINAWETHGSESVEYSAHMRYCDLDYYLKKYTNYIERRDKLTGKLKHCYVFSCVRNPWERLVSYWINWQHMHNRKRAFNKWLKEEKHIYPKSLKRDIRNTVEGKEYGRYPILMPQVCYLTNNGTVDGKLMVNYIVRFENLQEDLKIVGEQIDIDFSNIPYVNCSKYKPATKCYTKESLYFVDEHFSVDIDLFDYKYEGI